MADHMYSGGARKARTRMHTHIAATSITTSDFCFCIFFADRFSRLRRVFGAFQSRQSSQNHNNHMGLTVRRKSSAWKQVHPHTKQHGIAYKIKDLMGWFRRRLAASWLSTDGMADDSSVSVL